MKKEEESEPSPSRGPMLFSERVISACVGSVAVTFMMTPLDVVKVRMQATSTQRHCDKCLETQKPRPGIYNKLCVQLGCPSLASPSRSVNPLAMARYLVKQEGALTLWSGVRPTLVMMIPSNCLYFSTYETLRDWANTKSTFLPVSSVIPFASGIVARVVAASTVAPIELVRTQIQAHPDNARLGSYQLLQIARSGGVLSLFRGLGPTLLRDVPFSGFYWTVYEGLKPKVLKNKRIGNNQIAVSFLCGSVAGAVAAFLTTPFDVVKTHQQARPTANKMMWKGTITTLQKVWRAEGMSGLFAGVVPRCARVAPSCAIMISAYDFTRSYLNMK